jgi:hypothetical protein
VLHAFRCTYAQKHRTKGANASTSAIRAASWPPRRDVRRELRALAGELALLAAALLAIVGGLLLATVAMVLANRFA